VKLAHLGLPVRDVARSQRFYADYFGFDPAAAQRYEDGTVIIRNADAFDLALHEGWLGGKSVLRGRKVVTSDPFSSVEHGSSVEVGLPRLHGSF
jgi:catechol 2,3-dioxygenase-like lactoylglutathione lyase family enzyme